MPVAIRWSGLGETVTLDGSASLHLNGGLAYGWALVVEAGRQRRERSTRLAIRSRNSWPTSPASTSRS